MCALVKVCVVPGLGWSAAACESRHVVVICITVRCAPAGQLVTAAACSWQARVQPARQTVSGTLGLAACANQRCAGPSWQRSKPSLYICSALSTELHIVCADPKEQLECCVTPRSWYVHPPHISVLLQHTTKAAVSVTMLKAMRLHACPPRACLQWPVSSVRPCGGAARQGLWWHHRLSLWPDGD